MASYFHLSSVKEFARQITSATSEERREMLEDFYASQYPEVKGFFTADAASESIKSASVRSKSQKGESRIRGRLSDSEALTFKESTNSISHTCSPATHKGKSIQFPSHSSCQEEALPSDAGTLGSTQGVDDGKHSHASKGAGTSSSLDGNSKGQERRLANAGKDQQGTSEAGVSRSRLRCKPESKKTASPVAEDASVGGLLGDTSILEDLFKTPRSGPTRLPRKALSGPVEKAKQRPKDFWDILNEQSADSLSKFTDLAVIETLCEKAPSRSRGEQETSLWKSNEKFLWKTFQSSDTDENTTNSTQTGAEA